MPAYSVGNNGLIKGESRGWMGEMHPNVFGENIFSLISNLFDNNWPNALSTHKLKCVNKMRHTSIWRNTSELGAKKLKKICLKNVHKTLKWSLQYVNF